MGRTTHWSPQLAAEICRRMAEGESLRAICESEGMPSHSTVLGWRESVEGFADQYARAREDQADALFEDMQAIADDGKNDWMERNDPNNSGYVANGEHIQRSRLRIDTLKWRLARMSPKKYGERTDVAVSGNVGLAVLIEKTGLPDELIPDSDR